MAVICPTVTAYDTDEYRKQIGAVKSFAQRLHLDFMDGTLTPTLSPEVEQAWWPEKTIADLHIMYQQPAERLATYLKLKPHLVIVHAEAEGQFVAVAKKLHEAGIKAGVALLKETKPELIKPGLEHIDHVLIFSGKLGYYGGTADLKLLEKVKKLKAWKPSLEIGWDGGVDDTNAKQLVDGGVDVLNAGGFIQNAEQPQVAYDKLKKLIS